VGMSKGTDLTPNVCYDGGDDGLCYDSASISVYTVPDGRITA
jgi:hypothetical protein